ncbi:MAG: competence/damage-inducible protein A [Clostridia bacterium]|nr:competence/damage-inducible protein A [Clostridia bacterium]
MHGEIISVGTEILLGDIVDTNSAYLAKELSKYGIDVYYISSVGDNKERIKQSVINASQRSQIIFLTGGLGPTEDDLTKEALCEALEIPLYEDQNEVKRIKNYFKNREIEMSTNNLKQALIPEGAIILENTLGTASGLILEKDQRYYILLPGPPKEMKILFTNQVIPWLNNKLRTKGTFLHSHTLKFLGISESKLDWELQDIFKAQTNPTISILAKDGEIHCRLSAKVSSQEEFNEIITPVKEEILKRLREYYFASDDTRIEEIVGSLLNKKRWTLATAESCTGGLIAQRITDIPGSSRYFLGGIIAYDNAVKKNILGVPEEILEKYGAVSQETALAMAQGVRKLLQADISLAITGIAGPQGGTADKPVGLVYIALVGENINKWERFIFSGTRNDIRWRSANWALYLLKRSLEQFESRSF